MVRLYCALVNRRPFPVDVDEDFFVYALMEAILEKNPTIIKGDASNLALFLAKKNEMWLDEAGLENVTLDERNYPQGFEEMDTTLWIKNARYFGSHFNAESGDIHVLAVIPPQDMRLN